MPWSRINRLRFIIFTALVTVGTACADDGSGSRTIDQYGDAGFSRPGLPPTQSTSPGTPPTQDAGGDVDADAEDATAPDADGAPSGELRCQQAVACLDACATERYGCHQDCNDAECRNGCELAYLDCRQDCFDRVIPSHQLVFEEYYVCVNQTCDFHEFEEDWSLCVGELCGAQRLACPR